MEITLRPYQSEAIEKTLESLKKGLTRHLINLPTGSGKTVIMAALAKKLGKKTLLLAHREELISQAQEKFKTIWPEASIGVCMAKQNETDAKVVFGSIQSCFQESRLKKLKDSGFDLLLIDEAHHASSPSYQKVIEELGFYDKDPNKLLVGVTATPMRSDEKELGNTFEKITFSLSIGTMIESGYLCPIIGRRILTSTSLNGVGTRGGDFSIAELSEAVNTTERNHIVAENFKKYAIDRKGIVFCSDVSHCKEMAESLKRLSIKAKAIYGDMDTDERKEALKELKSGKIQVVTSCGVLTEGFDEPSISCIAMARPTKFKGLYIQCVGRGLRTHPSKSDCLVLDFCDENHDLSALATLKKSIPEAFKKDSRNEEREGPFIKTLNIKRVCDEEFDVLGSTRFIWIPIGDDEWSLADDQGYEIVISPFQGEYVAKLYNREGADRLLFNRPLSIEYCTGLCEEFARKHLKLNFASNESLWLNSQQGATESQIAFLQKRRVTTEGLTKSQATMMIRKSIAKQRKRKRLMNGEPVTEKQSYLLSRFGIDPRGMSKLEATRKIGMIKNGGVVVNV